MRSEDNPLVQSAGYGCLLPIAIIIIAAVVLLMLFHADGNYSGALIALVGHKVRMSVAMEVTSYGGSPA